MHDLLDLPRTVDRRPSAPAPAGPSSAARRTVRPSGVAVLGVALVLLGQAVDLPLLVLVGAGLAVCACLQRSTRFWVAAPAALVVLLSLAIGLASAASVLDIDLVRHRALLRAGQLAAAGGAALWSARGGSRVRERGADGPTAGLIAAPAAVAATIGLLQSAGGRSRDWALTGTDIAEHVRMLGDNQATGHLDYGISAYPQGWHALLALTTTGPAPARSPALLLQDIDLYTGSLWLVFALVLLLAAGLAHELTRGLGLSPRASTRAALLTGCSLLTSSWVNETFLHMGSTPTLVVVLALWWLAAEACSRPSGFAGAQRLLVVAVLATEVTAHCWQGLVPVPVLATLGWAATRSGRRDLRLLAQSGKPALLTGGFTAIVAALALPPVLALLQHTSVAAVASADGALTGPPLLLVAAVLLLPVVYRRRLPAGGAVALAAWAALVGLVALLLSSSGHPTDVRQYYPLKALSVLALCATPWCLAAGVLAWTRATRALLAAPSAARIRPLLTGATAVATALLAVSLIGPGLAREDSLLVQNVTGAVAHGHAGTHRLDLAVQHARAGAVVVPAGVGVDAGGDYPAGFVVSKLAAFLTDQPEFSGRARFVCDHVVLAQQTGGRAVVLTELPRRDVLTLMRRRGCSGAEVVQVPAADPVSAAALATELAGD